jgi:hypothetical protein
MSAAEAAGGFENAWPGFDTYLNGVAEKVTDEVLPRWVGRLAAADVFSRSHAWEVVEPAPHRRLNSRAFLERTTNEPQPLT